MQSACPFRAKLGSGRLPSVPNDTLAGIAAGHVGELAFKGRRGGPAVDPLDLHRRGGQGRVVRLRGAVDGEAGARQRLEGGRDRAIRIEIMRPGETAAQRQDRALHRPGFVGANAEFAARIRDVLGIIGERECIGADGCLLAISRQIEGGELCGRVGRDADAADPKRNEAIAAFKTPRERIGVKLGWREIGVAQQFLVAYSADGRPRTKSRLMLCRSGRDCLPYQVDRDRSRPIRIEHHKTGGIIYNPLGADGVTFYADAEEVLAKLPAGYQWSFASLKTGMPGRSRSAACNNIVQRMRKAVSKVDYVEALAH